MKRILCILLALALIAGGIVFGIFAIKRINKGKSFTPVQGVITRIDAQSGGIDENGNTEYTYYVFVKYTVDGTEYESELGEYQSSYREGDSIEVKYNPDNPSEIQSTSTLSAILTIAMPIVAVLAGAVLLFKSLFSR